MYLVKGSSRRIHRLVAFVSPCQAVSLKHTLLRRKQKIATESYAFKICILSSIDPECLGNGTIWQTDHSGHHLFGDVVTLNNRQITNFERIIRSHSDILCLFSTSLSKLICVIITFDSSSNCEVGGPRRMNFKDKMI